jgi:hypothetical protein
MNEWIKTAGTHPTVIKAGRAISSVKRTLLACHGADLDAGTCVFALHVPAENNDQ